MGMALQANNEGKERYGRGIHPDLRDSLITEVLLLSDKNRKPRARAPERHTVGEPYGRSKFWKGCGQDYDSDPLLSQAESRHLHDPERRRHRSRNAVTAGAAYRLVFRDCLLYTSPSPRDS